MAEQQQIPRARTRAESAEEAALAAWFEQQARDPFTTLEAAAQQIIQLVTALYAVVFGILAFAADPLPRYLSWPSVRGLALVAVLGYLVALLAALAVVIPREQRYAVARLDQQAQIFQAIRRRKYLGVQIAVWAFGIASVAFAGLFVVVLLGL